MRHPGCQDFASPALIALPAYAKHVIHVMDEEVKEAFKTYT